MQIIDVINKSTFDDSTIKEVDGKKVSTFRLPDGYGKRIPFLLCNCEVELTMIQLENGIKEYEVEFIEPHCMKTQIEYLLGGKAASLYSYFKDECPFTMYPLLV